MLREPSCPSADPHSLSPHPNMSHSRTIVAYFKRNDHVPGQHACIKEVCDRDGESYVSEKVSQRLLALTDPICQKVRAAWSGGRGRENPLGFGGSMNRVFRCGTLIGTAQLVVAL